MNKNDGKNKKLKEKAVENKTYRLVVARSVGHTMAQVVERETGRTVLTVVDKRSEGGTKTERARAVGVTLAKMALKKGIERMVFDRNSRPYHGRVSAVAQGAKEGGLKV